MTYGCRDRLCPSTVNSPQSLRTRFSHGRARRFRFRMRIRLAIVSGMAGFVFSTGCALTPQFGLPPIEGPPAPILLTAEKAPIVQANDPVPVPSVNDFRGYPQIEYPGEYELPRERVRRARPRVPQPEVVAETPPAMPDSASPPPDEPITIITRGGADTRESVGRELEEATRLVRVADSGELTETKRERVRNLYDLIDQAERALERGDVSSAAGLARKARVLATELTAP